MLIAVTLSNKGSIFSLLSRMTTLVVFSFYICNMVALHVYTYKYTCTNITHIHHNIGTCENKMQTKWHTNILRKLEDEEVSAD
jgi:hypothetical protein